MKKVAWIPQVYGGMVGAGIGALSSALAAPYSTKQHLDGDKTVLDLKWKKMNAGELGKRTLKRALIGGLAGAAVGHGGAKLVNKFEGLSDDVYKFRRAANSSKWEAHYAKRTSDHYKNMYDSAADQSDSWRKKYYDASMGGSNKSSYKPPHSESSYNKPPPSDSYRSRSYDPPGSGGGGKNWWSGAEKSEQEMPDWLKGAKTKADAKDRYRKAARAHHPDVGGSEEKMKKINTDWSEWESFFKKAMARIFE